MSDYDPYRPPGGYGPGPVDPQAGSGQPAPRGYGAATPGQPGYGPASPGQRGYGPATPPGYAPPGYGAATPYPPAGSYWAQPQPGPYGQYPAPGYGGYPGYPGPGPTRPGQVLAAAVLGYIEAGLLIIAGLFLFAGASIVSDTTNALGAGGSGYTAEFVIDGVVDLACGGLLIAGAVMMTGRRPTGRMLFTVGGAVAIAAGVYWIVRFHDGGVAVWAGIFMALPIIAIALLWTGGVSPWLNGQTARSR